MDVASKATATEKGLKGSCVRKFVGKNKVMFDVPSIISHLYLRDRQSKAQINLFSLLGCFFQKFHYSGHTFGILGFFEIN